MARTGLALAVSLCTLSSAAQQGLRPEPAGTISGHVTCSDTQRPARLAQVKLVRVPTKADVKAEDTKDPQGDAAPAGNAVETRLDGSYIFRQVKPGLYYVVVDQEGYSIPLGQFSAKELAATDDETRARVAKAVHPVLVEANGAVTEDVVLERGASVSGTVTYDDGTPASGIAIELLNKGKDGKWERARINRYRQFYQTTDDNGHYRLSGLPPGEYATQANLSLSDHESTYGPMPGNPGTMVQFEMQKTRFSLPLYSGDVLRKPDAKAYVLGSGEARAGNDLVFPLAKLHRVDGRVVAKDGHPINGGDVKVLYPDDRSEMTTASIQFDDQAFHLEYVPEGDYLLEVAAAKDLTRVQVENPAGYTPRFHEETRTMKTYGDAEHPLSVTGDTSDVQVTVPDSGKAKSAASAPAF